jgi:large subunit ribosomal protein L25
MSEYGNLEVELRTSRGKGATRTLRSQGKIPAVIYGAGEDNVAIALDPSLFKKATDPNRQWNTIYNLTIRGDGRSKALSCVLVEMQKHSVRDDFMHLDFMRIDLEKEVVRKVPVVFSGRSVGVLRGGRFKSFRRWVRVAAKPMDLPVQIEVDISNIDGGESLRVADVQLANARIVEDPKARLCGIEIPKIRPEEAAKEAKKS